MAQRDLRRGSWWQTLPGMLTAAAAFITAGTGLIIALNQAGVFKPSDTRASGGGAAQANPPLTPDVLSSSGPRTPGTLAGHESPATAGATVTIPTGSAVNLLAPDHGGQLLLAPNELWSVTNDGKEDDYQSLKVGDEAVFAFKDERRATFDRFRIFIPGKGRNPKDLDLEASDDSSAGPFHLIATFHPQNVRMVRTGGWQDFDFPPVTAKYVKVRLRSNYEDVIWLQLYELQIIGSLQ